MAVSFADLHGRLVELHLHVDGSISVPAARRLAELGGEPLNLTDAEVFDRLSVGEECEDLGEYLDKFVFPLSLVQTREQVEESVFLLQEDLRRQGCVYAELRFAPQSQCERGLTQREVVEASLKGLRRSDLDARLILCCMRGPDNLAANLETVELAAEYLGDEVVAVDLAGAEALFPTRDFAPVFARARELGVPFTIHAGEADGPQSVRDALAMGASRIGHGVRSVEDPELVRELADRQVPLEVCFTSEVQTGALKSYRHAESLRQLLDAGCLVTLNSDNCSVSNTWLAREFVIVSEALGLTAAEVDQLLLNAVEASFASERTKARLREVVAGRA